MIKSIYFIKSGNNGATYIFNTKDISNINFSLKFYKAFTSRQKIVKAILFLYLLLTKLFKKASLLDKSEVINFLKRNTLENIDFQVNDDCSILISPTKDKIIVHNHIENSFDKYAFGKSLDGVKNESSVYELLDKKHTTFNISKISDFKLYENHCKFKLSNKLFRTKSDDISKVALEFFEVKTSNMKIEDYFESRFLDKNSDLDKYYKFFLERYTNKTLILGLVHKDFKPWNMDLTQGPLIYDFEETTFALPLEDLINYYVDPMISTNSEESILEFINSKTLQIQINNYLKDIRILEDKEFYISQYLFERAYFWDKRTKPDISSKYKNILKAFLNDK